MNLDDRLTEAFRAKAATARTSPDAFTLIRDRVRRQRRLRLLEIAGAGLAVPAIVALAVVVTRPATREPQVDTPPVTSSPSETASPSPSATASAPTEPSVRAIPPPTEPPNDAAYADAIAVARAGMIELITPGGASLGWFPTPKGSTVERLQWSPDRREVYASMLVSTDDGDCHKYKAIAIDVRTRKTRQLGTWSYFAFSSDGKQLAVVEYPDCGPARLLIRNLATGKERRIPAASGDAESALFDSLAWVPGVDRIVLVQHGPGDSTDLWLLDLSTARAINDGTRLEVGDPAAGETVAAATYAGNRLTVALICCLNTPERLRIVERIGTTGEVRELLVVTNRWGFQLHSSPDGKQLAFLASNSGGQQDLLVWSGAGDPQPAADDVVAIAW